MENGQRYHFAPKFRPGFRPRHAGGPERAALQMWSAPNLDLAKWPEQIDRASVIGEMRGSAGCVSVLRAWVATRAGSGYEGTP
jgi:hypothetical protein